MRLKWGLSSGCLFLTQFMSQKNSPHYHLSLELIQPSPTVLCPLSVKKNQENKDQKSFKSLSDCIVTMHWIEAILVNHYNPIKHRQLGTPHSSPNILPPTCQSHVDLLWWGKKTEKNQCPEICLYTTKGISWNLQGYVHYHTAALKRALERFAPTMWSANIWDWGYLCLFHLLSHFAL